MDDKILGEGEDGGSPVGYAEIAPCIMPREQCFVYQGVKGDF